MLGYYNYRSKLKKEKRKTKWFNKPKWHYRGVASFYIVNRLIKIDRYIYIYILNFFFIRWIHGSSALAQNPHEPLLALSSVSPSWTTGHRSFQETTNFSSKFCSLTLKKSKFYFVIVIVQLIKRLSLTIKKKRKKLLYSVGFYCINYMVKKKVELLGLIVSWRVLFFFFHLWRMYVLWSWIFCFKRKYKTGFRL